jgi:hypothetical protein
MGRKQSQGQRSDRAGRREGLGADGAGLKAKRHFTPEERREAVAAHGPWEAGIVQAMPPRIATEAATLGCG